ncbi:MAG TPA: acyl-CoA dehydrogenase family protein [Myxococcota bacterium]|nr:acyl-CoA dehydrogenase family protein [Myxococcota bacterium]
MAVSSDALRLAKSLRPILEAQADATDDDLTLSKPCIDAFTRTNLFHVMVPEELGGYEADTDTCIDVFEELAHQDGSIGWTHMANASATAYCAFLDPQAAREMVGGQPGSVFAGQFAPRGKATRAPGGFRVGGSYSFGSGSAHASHLGGGGFVLGDNNAPEMLPIGFPAYLCWFARKDSTLMQGGWDVMGLRGTGSFDYTIPEQVIEAGRTFFLFDPQVRTGGALFRMGATALAGLGHADWGLGVAQRALDEIEKLATGGRARMMGGAIRDQVVFQRGLGEKAMALRSVRLLVHEVFGGIVARLAKGEPMSKPMNDDVMGSVAYMTQVAQDVTLFAYQWAGSHGLRNPSLVQRCFRDMFTGGQHIYVDRKSYEEVAKGRLGIV